MFGYNRNNNAAFDFGDWVVVNDAYDMRHGEELVIIGSDYDKATMTWIYALAKGLDERVEGHYGQAYLLRAPYKNCRHEWINTGSKKTWCKHCNKDGWQEMGSVTF